MKLQEFFNENKKVALAFSGGVDSSFLLYAAKKYGADVKGYFVKSQFQPEFELKDGLRLAEELKVNMKVINVDILSNQQVVKNPANRCYYCKQAIFKALIDAAGSDGYDIIIDGTNASDEIADRPGIKALEEMKVLSPLRLCNITKNQIRELSKEAGLFTWEKPSYACIATRIPAGKEILGEDLVRVEKAEDSIRALGFTDFRVRMFNKSARLQIKENQMEKAIAMRKNIIKEIKPYFDVVLLDLEER